MPVGPEDAVGLDVQVHRIDTHTGVALEGLLIAPVRHARVQAADFIVISYVENLTTAVHVWKENKQIHDCHQSFKKDELCIKQMQLWSSLSALQVSLILVKYLWQLHL